MGNNRADTETQRQFDLISMRLSEEYEIDFANPKDLHRADWSRKVLRLVLQAGISNLATEDDAHNVRII